MFISAKLVAQMLSVFICADVNKLMRISAAIKEMPAKFYTK